MTPTREDAWALLTEYTSGEGLLKHALAVEAGVRGYAGLFGENEEAWGVVGLIHDSTMSGGPTRLTIRSVAARSCVPAAIREFMIPRHLVARGYSGVARDSKLEHTLFACDELAGFITAAALGPTDEERARSGGPIRQEADEGQSLCPRREP